MAKIRWACPECEVETHFKGLCRKCTEYDNDGRPVKPVHRVRLNHTSTTNNPPRLTKDDFLNARRRNPTKKQLEAIKDHINSHSKVVHLQHEHEHECDEGCDHSEEFTEVGESIGSEEE
jgi:hypothetical protein